MAATLKTTRIPVRLERTRDVQRELPHSARNALPILAGIAGPIVVTSFALLAWAGVPPMKAVTLPWREGTTSWIAQAVLAAWPSWALRRRLLSEAGCVQVTSRALWMSDLAVSAAMLAPLAALCALSADVFAFHRPARSMRWTARPRGALPTRSPRGPNARGG